MTNRDLSIHLLFHLNLHYSSIEAEQRGEVLRRCYWPLLRLASEEAFPIGVEAPAVTLEAIADLDPSWLDELRRQIAAGRCELIGSGYAQLIGPLVPAEVNRANLIHGARAYEQLLGIRPRLAYVNEQAYSAGLVAHYREAGCSGIIMEWDNAARDRRWDPRLRFFPQRALDPAGATIPVVWNSSIAFQKFQRYAHGEVSLAALLDYWRRQADAGRGGCFLAYGSDAEVFDFRPGRYASEPTVSGDEWGRIRDLVRALSSEQGLRPALPSEALGLLDHPQAGEELRLEAPLNPIVVKKQGKYNVTRWAVTGRDDLGINTACWRILRRLDGIPLEDEAWRELCALWASDYRTHIAPGRWDSFQERLARAAGVEGSSPRARGASPEHRGAAPPRKNDMLTVTNGDVTLRLNCRRGLALDAAWFHAVGEDPLLGTLPHGYFEHIDWSADFYTGHLVLEPSGGPKVTDLNPVEPSHTIQDGEVIVRGEVVTAAGVVEKTWRLEGDRIHLRYRLSGWRRLRGSVRLGHITLLPTAFTEGGLELRTHNGGRLETFELTGRTIEQGRAVSSLISARGALGLTEGEATLGDSTTGIRLEFDKAEAALVGLLTHREISGRTFCRLTLTAREQDDTSTDEEQPLDLDVQLTLSAARLSR